MTICKASKWRVVSGLHVQFAFALIGRRIVKHIHIYNHLFIRDQQLLVDEEVVDDDCGFVIHVRIIFERGRRRGRSSGR